MTTEVLKTHDIKDTTGRHWAMHPEHPVLAVEFETEEGVPLQEPLYLVNWNPSKVTESQMPTDTLRDYWAEFENCLWCGYTDKD